MLLLVSSVFLLLNLPSHAIRVQYFFMDLFYSHYKPSRTFIQCQNLFTLLYNCNFAVNFILYSICGRKFRMSYHAMCKQIYHKIIHYECCDFQFRFTRKRSSKAFSLESLPTQGSNTITPHGVHGSKKGHLV